MHKKIVSAAGPYTGPLLKDVAPYFAEIIHPQRVFLAFLKIKTEVYDKLDDQEIDRLHSFYPVINSAKGTRDGSFFSMIEYLDENNHPIIKIGGHFQRSDIDDLDAIWEKELTQSEITWSLNNTADYFALLNVPVTVNDIEFIDGYSCVYSLTETEVPFVTPIIGSDEKPNYNAIVLGGMSGVGAKGAMTYGLMAANYFENAMETNQPDSMYMVVQKALGYDRLLEEYNTTQEPTSQ